MVKAKVLAPALAVAQIHTRVVALEEGRHVQNQVVEKALARELVLP